MTGAFLTDGKMKNWANFNSSDSTHEDKELKERKNGEWKTRRDIRRNMETGNAQRRVGSGA